MKLKGTQAWKGFLIEARRAGSSDTTPYGTFVSFDTSLAHTIDCSGGNGVQNALTQNDATLKTAEMIFTWQAPAINVGDIVIV